MAALAFALAWLIAPAATDTVTVEAVKADYEGAFHVVSRVTSSGDTLAGVLVPRTLPDTNLLAGLQRDNRFFLTYLVGNAIGFEWSNVLSHGPIEARKDAFYRALRSDRRFNTLLLPVVDRYLERRGIVLAGYEPPARDTVTAGRLRDIALRFFYADAVGADGSVSWRYCAKETGLEDFPHERNLTLEAFVYSALRMDMEDSAYGVRADFDRAVEHVGGLPLSTVPQVRRAEAQGAMWAFMAGSSRLRRLLISTYRARKMYLPFVVAIRTGEETS